MWSHFRWSHLPLLSWHLAPQKKLRRCPSALSPLTRYVVHSVALRLYHSSSQDPQTAVIDRPATIEVENWEIPNSSTDLDLQGEHRSPFLSRSRGSPQHASTAISNLEGAKSQSSIQPPLYLWSRSPSPISISPTRVKFAPEPQTRTVYLSSLRQTSRRIEIQKRACVSSDIAEMIDQGNHDLEEINTSATNFSVSSGHISAFHALDSTSTTHPILNSPPPNMKAFVCASSSSPHYPMQACLETESQLHGENPNSSQDTLASFPRPPPLKVKRRPEPLVLLPTLTADRLPPSPIISSTDSTPSVTPLSTPRSSKFPNRPLHTVIPPRCSPPNTPLPTPPTSSAFLAPPDHGKLPGAGKVLRTIHSTSELHDHWFEVTCPMHNSVSTSTPPADVFISDNASMWRSKLNSKSYSSLVGHLQP